MNREKKVGRGKRVAVWSLIFVAIAVFGMHPFTMGLLTAMMEKTANTVHAENTLNPEAMAAVMYRKSIETLKDEVVQSLEKCESGGAEGLIIFDQNSSGTLKGKNIASIGVMQFKVSTVQLYEKQLYGKMLSDKEAILVALDKGQAEALAKDVVFNVSGGLFNWSCYTSEMKLRVEIIKSMQK